MRILLLLSGYTCKRVPWGFGDKGTPEKNNMSDFFDGSNYLKKLLINHEVKTICGLWNDIGLEEVNTIYNPEICISSSQEELQEKLKLIFGDYESKRIKKRDAWLKKKNIKNNLVSSSFRIASQLYSRQIVIKEAIEFINKTSYNPDIIILTRYDISCRGGAYIRNPVRISPSIYKFLNSENSFPKVILPLFNQLNAGMPDMWFYLNTKALYKMRFIYDEYINVITSKDSKYKKLLTEGWPFSEYFDLLDTNDIRQFSNILVTNKKNYRLMQYHDWELPNIHAFLKYFFLLNETDFKLKFISRKKSILSMFLFANYKNILLLGFKELFSGIKSKFIYMFRKKTITLFL
tara:strand:+ start:6301 stop:7344 length:1044 start_codon:yes stop_codon:yes gene_type:complete